MVICHCRQKERYGIYGDQQYMLQTRSHSNNHCYSGLRTIPVYCCRALTFWGSLRGEVTEKMAKLLRDRYFWYTFAFIVLSGILLYTAEESFAGWLPSLGEWHDTFMLFYYSLSLTGVAIAAWRFGIKGGLATCLAIGLVLLPHVVLDVLSPFRPDLVIQLLFVATIAIMLSWLLGSRKRAEEEKNKIELQLRQSQKMEAIGGLSGGIAHDFNNLLTVITVTSDIMLNELAEDDPKHQDVKEIIKAAERAASLTRQLLAFSRKQVLEPEVLDINSVVGDTEKMLRRIIGEDIKLEVIPVSEAGSIKVDRGGIEQVIMNIVINARDAMPNGGIITIQIENITLSGQDYQGIPEAKPGSYYRLSITDTGTGMDETTREHIFEPFFTTKAKGKGTGLGLSTVYGIVKQSGGWINVYSEPGKGSTFRIYIPAHTASPEDQNKLSKEATSMEELKGNGERILLVEDEEPIRIVTQKLLSSNGYVVFSAESAEKALSIFKRKKGDFHLVLSDVVLPKKSGVELAGQLLALKPKLNILLSSGYADEKSQWSIIREKGYPFIQKPYTSKKLLHSIKENMKEQERRMRS